jgi:hypothetical protein
MRTTVALLVAALSVLAFTQSAAAREWRGCMGLIQISGHGQHMTIHQFEGRGSCRSRAYANDCRRAARGAILYCLQDAWRVRWSFTIPGSCRPTPGSSRPFVDGLADTAFGNGPGAQGAQDFKYAVERASCCTLFRNRDQVTVAVSGASLGDTRCDGSVVLQTGYRVGCARFRNRGYCG